MVVGHLIFGAVAIRAGMVGGDQGACSGEVVGNFRLRMLSRALVQVPALRWVQPVPPGSWGRWGWFSQSIHAGGAEDLSSVGQCILLLKIASKDLGC